MAEAAMVPNTRPMISSSAPRSAKKPGRCRWAKKAKLCSRFATKASKNACVSSLALGTAGSLPELGRPAGLGVGLPRMYDSGEGG